MQNPPKPHQSLTNTHSGSSKQPVHLSLHPTHHIQPDGGRHRLSVAVSQLQRSAVNAHNCIKCNCVSVFV